VLLVAAGGIVGLVLRTGTPTADARSPKPASAPFASAIQQRKQMVDELRALSRKVDEQTRFLKSGQLKVVIELRDARTKR
jgi:hypothetical protein